MPQTPETLAIGYKMDEFNKELCKERHKNIDDDIKGLKSKLWWYNTLAIGTLIGIVLNLLKDVVFK